MNANIIVAILDTLNYCLFNQLVIHQIFLCDSHYISCHNSSRSKCVLIALKRNSSTFLMVFIINKPDTLLVRKL